MSNDNRMWKTTVNHCLFSAAISNPLLGGYREGAKKMAKNLIPGLGAPINNSNPGSHYTP
jgi:hypothetical protein